MSQSSSLILNCILFISCQFSVFIRPYNNTEKKKDNPSTSNLQKFKRTICRKCKKFYFTILTSKPLSFSRSETFTSRTSGTRPCSPESTPWPPCCALWSPAPRTWPAVPPSASPCSGWTGWGWRQAWSSGSTSQSSDPVVGERRSYFKPQHVFTVRFHSSSCSSTLTCFQP